MFSRVVACENLSVCSIGFGLLAEVFHSTALWVDFQSFLAVVVMFQTMEY